MQAFGPVVALILLTSYNILPMRYFIIFAIESMTFLKVSVYLHDQYHIKDTWLERYTWFIERRYRHFYHHGHHMSNMSLGGIDTTFDKAFGVFVPVVSPATDGPLNVVPKKLLL